MSGRVRLPTCSRGAGDRMVRDRLLWGSLGPPTCPRGAGGRMAQGLAPVGQPAADVLTGGRRPDGERPAPVGQPRAADVPTGVGGRMAHDCCARRDLLPGGQWGRVAPRGPVRVVAGPPWSGPASYLTTRDTHWVSRSGRARSRGCLSMGHRPELIRRLVGAFSRGPPPLWNFIHFCLYILSLSFPPCC